MVRASPAISHLSFFANDSLFFSKATARAARELNLIFSVCKRASGQTINFQKSALSFNPNMNSADISTIKSIFGIFVAFRHSRYLGLPSSIS